ncbi:Pyridoxal phosphate biosynthesis protein [gamma proteobacterium HdN1]|nr:Pyridoxal phosphate biosynthesis protein [gamma proteobacterium HdN1]
MRIAVTPGEPAGIGPDLMIMAAQETWPDGIALVAIANAEMLARRAQQLGLGVQLVPDDGGDTPLPKGQLRVIDLALPCPEILGTPQPAHAHYLLTSLRIATEGCQHGHFQALVTGPLQKSSINDAGIHFSGHTEYLAELTHTPRVVMMLATEGLRVALATTHLPLRQVADAIQPALLEEICRITDRDLRERFGLAQPRIKVCGLNPHAGEGGHLGREELDIIIPTLARLKASGLNLQGPYPADTVFTPHHLADADAILAMYHDQGLPVLKHLGFGRAVNITLGLPIIRTSVDHGTALDLAGTGQIDSGSFHTAVRYAAEMARHSNQPQAPATEPPAHYKQRVTHPKGH